jgi:serine/threonine-protein kinase
VGLSVATLPQVIGRYALYGEIAAGGMATVHYGRLLGPVGFSRTVAIKRLHAQFAKDPEFVSMFLDEARLAARIRHPNVVQTLDVVALEGELFLVLDYVQGESLGRLIRTSRSRTTRIPLPVVSAIVCGALHGLHAAHDATNERGEPLHIVHRDVSPHNVLVGADGVPRVLDFGVAKAAGRAHTTRDGQVKGKLAYMAPEQLLGHAVDRRSDVYAAAAVLWETLTLKRLFTADNEGAIVAAVLKHDVEPPSSIATDLPKAVDEIVMRALDPDASKRFGSAREMALALEEAVPMASATRLAEWVDGLAGEALTHRATILAEIEHGSGSSETPQALLRSLPEVTTRSPSMPDGSLSNSQVSSLSLSTSALRRIVPSKERQWVPYAAVVGGVSVLAIGALAILHAGAGPTTPPSSTLAAAGQPATAAPTSPAPGSPPVVSVPPPPPMDLAVVAPSSSLAIPVAAARVVNPRPPSAPRASPPPPPAAAAAPKPCAVRSYVDDTGLTHFVKDCK